MLLREMTSSALAHSFKRFAQLAVAGLALAGLAACGGGGGGSSTPAEKTPATPAPEIPITPSPISDILAEAVSITGMEAVEGQLDSAEDAEYFKIQIDEPGTVTFWTTEADVEIQVLDSEGNVLATSQQYAGGGGGSSSGLAPAVAPAVYIAVVYTVRIAGPYLIRVAFKKAVKTAVRQGVRSRAAVTYVLRHRITRALIRKVRNFVQKNLEVGKPEDIDCSAHYETEGGGTLSCSASLVSLNLGPFRIGIEAAGSNVRLNPGSSSECRSRGAPTEASISLVARTRIPARYISDEIASDVESLTAISRDIVKRTLLDNGPRLRMGGPPLSFTVAEGGSETMTLTDHIEDPDGGSLEFAVHGSAPAGWGVTPSGPGLTIAAREGAADGSITVAATDKNNVCRTFPLRVSVGTLKVKPEYSDGVTGSAVAGDTYISGDLSEYFDNPLDESLSFTVAHSGGVVRDRVPTVPASHNIYNSWGWGIYEDGDWRAGSSGDHPTVDRVPGFRLAVESDIHFFPGRDIRFSLTAENSAGSASLEFTITTAPLPSSPRVGCFWSGLLTTDPGDGSPSFDVSDGCHNWWGGVDDDFVCNVVDTFYERQVSQCPRAGGKYEAIESCLQGSFEFLQYHYSDEFAGPIGMSSGDPRKDCERVGGRYTRLK